jgi:hypothetical protein
MAPPNAPTKLAISISGLRRRRHIVDPPKSAQTTGSIAAETPAAPTMVLRGFFSNIDNKVKNAANVTGEMAFEVGKELAATAYEMFKPIFPTFLSTYGSFGIAPLQFALRLVGPAIVGKLLSSIPVVAADPNIQFMTGPTTECSDLCSNVQEHCSQGYGIQQLNTTASAIQNFGKAITENPSITANATHIDNLAQTITKTILQWVQKADEKVMQSCMNEKAIEKALKAGIEAGLITTTECPDKGSLCNWEYSYAGFGNDGQAWRNIVKGTFFGFGSSETAACRAATSTAKRLAEKCDEGDNWLIGVGMLVAIFGFLTYKAVRYCNEKYSCPTNCCNHESQGTSTANSLNGEHRNYGAFNNA